MNYTRKLMIVLLSSSMFLISCGKSDQKKQQEVEKNTTSVQTNSNQEEKEVILFFGNSLSAGYGVETKESFPGRIDQLLDSTQYDYKVVNAGVSGETTATGLSRVEWVVKRQNVAVFVLELGGNDGLRGIKPSETEKNLKKIIDKVRQLQPDASIVLAGMMVPPNMGQDYSAKFKKVFPSVAQEKEVTLIPFLLKEVGGEKELNQADGIHPTAEGHEIVAKTVWKYLEPLLESNKAAE